MSLPSFVYEDAKFPDALKVDVSPSETVPNLLLVSNAFLSVTTPDGSVVTWSCTMSLQTATTLRLTHQFAADGSDVATPGSYTVVPHLTLPDGERRAVPANLLVKPIT